MARSRAERFNSRRPTAWPRESPQPVRDLYPDIDVTPRDCSDARRSLWRRDTSDTLARGGRVMVANIRWSLVGTIFGMVMLGCGDVGDRPGDTTTTNTTPASTTAQTDTGETTSPTATLPT